MPAPAAVLPGDVIEFGDGVHSGCRKAIYNGTAGAPITIRNAAGADAVLSGPTLSPPQVDKTACSLFLGGSHLIVEENPNGGTFRIEHPVGSGAGNGFVVAANYCELRNLRMRGTWNHGRGRVLGGRASGLVFNRIGYDPIGAPRGSGYFYIQNDGRSQYVVTDCLFALGFTSLLHVFGGDHAARDVVIRRTIGFGGGALSYLGGDKPCVVIDEENTVTADGKPAVFDDVEIDDCVFGSPHPYPSGGGMAHPALQLGAGKPHVNGRVTLRNTDFLGRLLASEKVYVRNRGGCRVIFRPGSGVNAQGWAAQRLDGTSNLLEGNTELMQAIATVGFGDELPNLPPQVRVYANPTETGRSHVSVLAFKGETSCVVDLTGVVQRGQRYIATDVMRERVYEFKGGTNGLVELPLEQRSPADVNPDRDPHPVTFPFLVRRAV